MEAPFSTFISVMLAVFATMWITQSPQKTENLQPISTELQVPNKSSNQPAYWVYSHEGRHSAPNGVLRHVETVLGRAGWRRAQDDGEEPWTLMWAHDYPFTRLRPKLIGNKLQPHQRVNHFPGIGHLTLKVDFASTISDYIPRSFRLPAEGSALLEHAEKHPGALFVLKDNEHRRVFLKNVTEMNLTQEGNFVQEYVQQPYLVDGHRFDIGVYTILTSVNPLRAYIYKGDVLFRYCPRKYYPFDWRTAHVDQYVVGDDYLPTWQLPSLSKLYGALHYGMKDSFDAYVTAQGKDPSIVWRQVDEFFEEMLLKKEELIMASLKNYGNPRNFFELMRFDFVIDETLRLFAIEANMSPNLSSAHFPPNRLLYEQVLYSTLALVGVARYTKPQTTEDNEGEREMIVSNKNLVVWSSTCNSETCRVSCEGACFVCLACWSMEQRASLATAFGEHLHRTDCRRVFPPAMEQGVDLETALVDVEHLSEENQLQHLWFQGKCNTDITWCI